MGAFLTNDKSGYYWFLLGYLQDKNIYVRDSRLLPYTPGKLQTYVDYYPRLYNPVLPVTLSFRINGHPVAQALISMPSGAAYANIQVPAGAFTFETWNGSELLRTEHFLSKNYAMFLGVQAQSYDERAADLQLVAADQDFYQMRSSRLYEILGAFFDFPPPPGWPLQDDPNLPPTVGPKYRDCLLGGCGPGLRQAFFDGTTQAGIIEAVESVTCLLPSIGPAQGGVRWTVLSRSNPNYQPSNAAKRGFYVTTRANMGQTFVPPHYRAICSFENWWGHAAVVTVNGASRTPPPETVRKDTDSFIESPIAGGYTLDGLTLSFSVKDLASSSPAMVYNTSFPMPTRSAADAAAQILLQNPSLTSAVYDTSSDTLRIGIAPVAGKVFRVTITGGTAMPQFGWKAGNAVDVSCDQLANPWLTTPVSITAPVGGPWVDGVDFTSAPSTGQIVWNPVTAANLNPPPSRGTLMTANYTYQVRREIEFLVNKVKETNDIISYVWK